MLLKGHACRLLARPRSALAILVFFFLVAWMAVARSRGINQVLPFGSRGGQSAELPRNSEERREKVLQAQRQQFEEEAVKLERQPGFGAIYGNTLETLIDEDIRIPAQADQLGATSNSTISKKGRPVSFNPYPNYNNPEWESRHAEYVPCIGATGKPVEDIQVFKGRSQNFPNPGFGSHDVLGLDRNICFERDTRMAQYGFGPVVDKNGVPVDWDSVNWGDLQHQCVERNQARFNTRAASPKNEYIADLEGSADLKRDGDGGQAEPLSQTLGRLWRGKSGQGFQRRSKTAGTKRTHDSTSKPEARTAVLLRSFSGKTYTENDKQVIRSLITELSLRTGGEYEVVLFVHVKETDVDIFASDEAYNQAIEDHVPAEFRSIAVLWNEPTLEDIYPMLTSKARKVHSGQFLPVQLFMQEFREFDYVWNWEMDSRVVGHHYDMLNKLAEFGRKEPRRGIWERSERYFIPSFYGSYDSGFRYAVERDHGNQSVWGPPAVPESVVKPQGPKPPVATPQEDNFKWGVGEEADLITLAPMFNPVNSGWILRNQVWGYRSVNFPWGKLPRRTTIITQLRASRKLLDLMHAEDLRGNHVASEMACQTTALLHGLKAVYAPMPVFFDRAWSGSQLAKWFNGGPKGESGSFGSAMAWGQEGRFLGSTWYYRAFPPQRLYNNWMGYEDTRIGGPEWEAEHGRPCLPSMILHPIKEIKPTERGFSTDSQLPYH